MLVDQTNHSIRPHDQALVVSEAQKDAIDANKEHLLDLVQMLEPQDVELPRAWERSDDEAVLPVLFAAHSHQVDGTCHPLSLHHIPLILTS